VLLYNLNKPIERAREGGKVRRRKWRGKGDLEKRRGEGMRG